MEALREYLKNMPSLAEKILEQLGEILETESFDRNNAEEMREAFAKAHQRALDGVKQGQLPYYAVTFPQATSKCSECRAELKGAYWEIANPISCSRGMFRVPLMHHFLEHGNPFYSEPIINMSETQLGIDEHKLDAKKLAKILNGLPVPPAVTAELEAALAASAGK